MCGNAPLEHQHYTLGDVEHDTQDGQLAIHRRWLYGSPAEVLSAAGVFDYHKAALLAAIGEDIYERRFARSVLLRLEYLYFSNSSVLNLPDDLRVEHILPQTPAATSQWVQTFGEADRK